MFAKKSDMEFGRALALLKGGKRVARAEWKIEMFIFLSTEAGITGITLVDGENKSPGWVPSQEDMLASDWYLLPDTATNEKDGKVRLTVHVPSAGGDTGERAKMLLKDYDHLGGDEDFEQARINLHYRVPEEDAGALSDCLGNMGYHTTISDV